MVPCFPDLSHLPAILLNFLYFLNWYYLLNPAPVFKHKHIAISISCETGLGVVIIFLTCITIKINVCRHLKHPTYQ